jgi:chromosome segregation ATPase
MQNDFPLIAATELNRLIEEIANGESETYIVTRLKQVAEHLELFARQPTIESLQIAQLRADLQHKDDELNELETACDRECTRMYEKNDELQLQLMQLHSDIKFLKTDVDRRDALLFECAVKLQANDRQLSENDRHLSDLTIRIQQAEEKQKSVWKQFIKDIHADIQESFQNTPI